MYPTKKGVSLTFHKGSLLADPKRLLHGEGNYMRALLFRAVSDIGDSDAIQAIFEDAAHRQTQMKPKS